MPLEKDKAGRIAPRQPVRLRPSPVKRNRLLVHRGKLPRACDWNRLIDDVRDERMRKLAGR